MVNNSVFLVGMFRTEIRVPFFQTHLWYQFQAFAVIFRWMGLICANGKREFLTEFTSPEFCLPFTQTWSDGFAYVNGHQAPVLTIYTPPPKKKQQKFRLFWFSPTGKFPFERKSKIANRNIQTENCVSSIFFLPVPGSAPIVKLCRLNCTNSTC